MPANRLLSAALRLAPDPGPTDRDLLAAFAASRDEAAFAELVRRHGGLVLSACRRVTGHAQDAEDAFQAAFLVLARRAGQVQRPDQLGNWLYGVAVRTALDARSARRRIREQPLAAVDPAADSNPPPDPTLAAVVDEELAKLPEKYRAAVVLCELEGVPRKDAAAQIGVPEGTLSSRLAHARKLLAARLSRRGIVAQAGLLAALGPSAGGVAVPYRLIDHTARAAARGAGGAVPPGLVSDRVSSLTDGVLKAMLVSKLRLTAGAVALAVAAVGAAAVVAQQFGSTRPPVFDTPLQPLGGQGKAPALQGAKVAEKIAAKGIEDDDVPYPTAPSPAVVRVEEGKLVVRQRARSYSVPVVSGQGGAAKAPNPVVGRKYDAADVLVFDMKGNRLAPKAWRAKFEQDQHVLVSWGGVLPNPRELVLFKDDTLIVVFPGQPAGDFGPGATARTTYRAMTRPDGTVYYEPVTVYDATPVNTDPFGPTIPPAPSQFGAPVPFANPPASASALPSPSRTGPPRQNVPAFPAPDPIPPVELPSGPGSTA